MTVLECPLRSNHLSEDDFRLTCSVGMAVFTVGRRCSRGSRCTQDWLCRSSEGVAHGLPPLNHEQSKRHRRAVGKWPGVKRVQRIHRPAGVVLEHLRIAERGLLGNANIDAEAITIQRVVRILVGERPLVPSCSLLKAGPMKRLRL